MSIQTPSHPCTQIDKQSDRQTDYDNQADKQTARQTERSTFLKQTDIHTPFSAMLDSPWKTPMPTPSNWLRCDERSTSSSNNLMKMVKRYIPQSLPFTHIH